MKRALLLLLCIISVVNIVCAKDIIVLLDTTEIEASIVDIGQKYIAYKDWSNQDGPILTIEKSKVFHVKKQDGSKVYLSNEITIPAPATSTSSKFHDKYFKTDKAIHFQCYTYAGVVCYKNSDIFEAGPIVDLSLGVDVFKRFYIGTMFGLHTLFSNQFVYDVKALSTEFIIPIAPINFKFHIINNEIMNPFVDFSIGYSVLHSRLSINSQNIYNMTFGGLFMQAGIGYNADKFSFTVGWTGVKINNFAHMWHVKLGARF
jgi:hypothetical protein